MPRFTGDTHRNSRVYIDYVKDTVIFEPVGKVGLIANWFLFVFSIIATALIPICVFIFTSWVWIYFTSGASQDIAVLQEAMDYYGYKLFGALGIMAGAILLMSLPFVFKHWRKNYYPVFMATLDVFIHRHKTLECNSDAIVDNKYIIPFLGNVMVKYELRGDFAKTIETVKIVNLFVEDSYKWMCVFTFKEHPKNGLMRVQYI